MESEPGGQWNCYKLQLSGCHKKLNPLRNGPLRFACLVFGWFLACAISGVLWNSSLDSIKEEFQLTCYNRKEVETTLWTIQIVQTIVFILLAYAENQASELQRSLQQTSLAMSI
jgi:hypothetical protein